MRIDKGLLIKCIAIPLIVGGLAGLLTREGVMVFGSLNKPPLAPPAWLFPVVWTILYTLMGVSSYLILQSGADEAAVSRAISVYVYQLIVNFLWPTIFFQLQWYLFAFFWLVLLWILVVIMIIRFYNISKLAGYLQIPYLIWLTFAGYLNLAIWLLNE